MFEPVHGSAPKFAGKNVANPIGAIASASLMLETLGLTEEAAAIDAAILKAVRERQVTQDVGGTLGTREAGDFIAAASYSAIGDTSHAIRHEGHEDTMVTMRDL